MLLTAGQIAKQLDGKIIGDKTFRVNGLCDIEIGVKGSVSYIQSESYLKYLQKTDASVVIISENLDIKNFSDKVFIVVENASIAFMKLLRIKKYYLNPTQKVISKDSLNIGKETIVSENTTIGENVVIGKKCKIFPGCYIGDFSIIGDNTILYPNVVLYNHIIIGDSCQIDSGTVIGSDGFGLTKYKNKNYSIPHIGKVEIGNNVKIGANCCIDRGTINDTIIGDNCRLDNQIQIAHNVVLGEGCIIAAQVAIAGSRKLGKNVTVAGQTGIIDHVEIGENSIIAAKSFITTSMDKNEFYSGNPAVRHKQRLRQDASLKKLPSILKKIKI